MPDREGRQGRLGFRVRQGLLVLARSLARQDRLERRVLLGTRDYAARMGNEVREGKRDPQVFRVPGDLSVNRVLQEFREYGAIPARKDPPELVLQDRRVSAALAVSAERLDARALKDRMDFLDRKGDRASRGQQVHVVLKD